MVLELTHWLSWGLDQARVGACSSYSLFGVWEPQCHSYACWPDQLFSTEKQAKRAIRLKKYEEIRKDQRCWHRLCRRPHANLWSCCPGGRVCVLVAPWYPEVMQVCAQVGPPVSAPAGTPRWPPGPPRGRRREPLRSRLPDLRRAGSQSHRPSDRKKSRCQKSNMLRFFFFSFSCMQCDVGSRDILCNGWHLYDISHNLRCCYHQTTHSIIDLCVWHCEASCTCAVNHFARRWEDQKRMLLNFNELQRQSSIFVIISNETDLLLVILLIKSPHVAYFCQTMHTDDIPMLLWTLWNFTGS